MGVEVVAVEVAEDDRSLLNQRVVEMLGKIDMLIITGEPMRENTMNTSIAGGDRRQVLFWGVKSDRAATRELHYGIPE
jgi:molybdopterin biosynthesis enzyme